jgi:hypothetical protein
VADRRQIAKAGGEAMTRRACFGVVARWIRCATQNPMRSAEEPKKCPIKERAIDNICAVRPVAGSCVTIASPFVTDDAFAGDQTGRGFE